MYFTSKLSHFLLKFVFTKLTKFCIGLNFLKWVTSSLSLEQLKVLIVMHCLTKVPFHLHFKVSSLEQKMEPSIQISSTLTKLVLKESYPSLLTFALNLISFRFLILEELKFSIPFKNFLLFSTQQLFLKAFLNLKQTRASSFLRSIPT